MGLVASFALPHPPIILSQIGKGEEEKASKTIKAYEEIARQISLLKPDLIILVTPHNTSYLDYFHITNFRPKKINGDFEEFGFKEIKMQANLNEEFIVEFTKLASKSSFPAGILGEKNHKLDHGTMIPLHFVNKFYQDYELVRISQSGLGAKMHYKMGLLLAKTLQNLNLNAIFIASGDLSHKLNLNSPYGFDEDGPKYDEKVCEIFKNANFEELFTFDEDFLESAGECGQRSFLMMAGMLNELKIRSNLLSYEAPFGIGYLVASFEVLGQEKNKNYLEIYEETRAKFIANLRKHESKIVKFARICIENFIKNKTFLNPQDYDLSEFFKLKNAFGIFVSLKKDGALRGCMGEIGLRDLNEEKLARISINSATKDPRFTSVKIEELKDLLLSVDILYKLEKIKDISELDIKRYGVIVKKGLKSGLLLPNLKSIKSVREQISIAKQKAGLNMGEKDFEIYRFEAKRYF